MLRQRQPQQWQPQPQPSNKEEEEDEGEDREEDSAALWIGVPWPQSSRSCSPRPGRASLPESPERQHIVMAKTHSFADRRDDGQQDPCAYGPTQFMMCPVSSICSNEVLARQRQQRR